MADGDFDPRAYLAGLSAHAGRPGDTSNLNPDFAARLAAAIQQARAQGLPVGLESGFREPGTHPSAYDLGGNSSHTYGLAGDVSGLDGPNGKITRAWAQIAQANGLSNPYGIGNKSEFNHWQLPPRPLEQTPQILTSLKQAKATGDFQNVWNAYAPVAQSASASSPAVAAINRSAPVPGTTINSTGGSFLDALVQIESRNRNIPSQIDKDYPGQPGSKSQGYAQIDVPTWRQFAPRAGIDLSQFPTPMQASRDQQLQVASQIPLSRFGGITQRKLARQFGQLDASKTVGQLSSQFAPQAPGAPTARGGVSPPLPGAPQTAVASAAPPGAPASSAVPGAVPGGTSPLPGFAPQQGKDFLAGASAFEKASGLPGAGGQDQGGAGAPRESPFIGGPPAMNVGPKGGMMLSQGVPQAMSAAVTGYSPPPMYGTGLTSFAIPPQWNAAAPGQSLWQNAAGQAAGAQPLGTSLGSEQQLQALYSGMYQDPFGGFAYG